MDVIKVNLPQDIDTAEIHVLSDLHIGDKHCDIKLIKRRIDEIASKDNAYCILNGDIVNNATKTSIGDIYCEEFAPIEQVQRAADIIRPIKDKIIAITSGNHERRTYRKEGIDLSWLIAKDLGKYDCYTPGAAMIFCRLGSNQDGHHHSRPILYTMYCLHGSGGGRKEGAKAIRLADMASIVDADIYIHSHTHLPMVFKESFYRVDNSNSNIAPATKLFVNTSASLNYGGYAQEYEYKPNSTDSPIIYLDGRRKYADARL